MAEFVEVMRQAKRMCAAHGSMCISRNCPLDNGEACRLATDQDGEDYSGAERIIMDWAKEHPEPRYPTWHEYQQATFPNHMRWICPMTFGVDGLCDDIDDDHSAAECTRCRNRPIPERIARKLGLEPKKQEEPFAREEKGCQNCKYDAKAEEEEPCTHCRRAKAFGSAAWQGTPDLWKPRDRTEE